MSVTLGSPKPITKKETSESSSISGIGTQSSITPNQNLHSSDKSTPTMSSQQPTSPPQTSHIIAPQHSSVNESVDVSESKTMDDVSTKDKVHPSITHDMDSNIQSLTDLKTINFNGPNCHNASLMALGLEFTLFDNHTELIDGFVKNFTDKLGISGKTDELKSVPKDLQKGDIFVIKNSESQKTVHTFIYAGNDTFFQKNNQDPGEFYTSDLTKSLEKWLEPKDMNYHFDFTVHRPNLGKLESNNLSVSKPMSELKQTEQKFGRLLEQSWNNSAEFKNKHEPLKNEKYKEAFYPTPEVVKAVKEMKSLIDDLSKTIDEAEKDYDSMDVDDQNRFDFIKDQKQALLNQLESIVTSMKGPVMENRDVPDKKTWLKAFKFISNGTNQWF